MPIRLQLQLWGVIALAALLGACSGGSNDPSADPTNIAPLIAGTPPTSVMQGAAYSFAPTASDQNGDALLFGIDAKPAWASFNTATGQLMGTPTATDVGTSRGIVIWVTDGKSDTALPAFDLTVQAQGQPPPANHAPTISGTPMTSAAAGIPYSFAPTAADQDDNPLTFAIGGKPSWASFSTQTGALTGTPPTAGTFSGIIISVSDGSVSTALAAFTISVTAPTSNRAPTISGTPATSAKQGTAYAFQPTAADADGDMLTFTIANLPTWATFDTSTGRLSGTPGAANVRTYSSIVISVSDGKASTPLPAFAITVASSNTPPTISGTPPTTATVGTQYTFTPAANDANAGTTLTFSIANKPSWASFSTTTGLLQGTPSATGTFANVTISVSDGQASAQLAAFTITVSAAAPSNHAPTISGTPATSVMQGMAYSFAPTASDADNDTLTFSIANKPTWAQFNTGNGALTGTPTAGDVGTTAGIVISVSDGKVSAALAAFSIAVVATATGSATISWTPPTTYTDGSALTVGGYRIYWGTTQNNYTNSKTLNGAGFTSAVIDQLTPATYYFVVTTFDSAGTESVYSNVATKTIQ
jgi:hypothetical protein